MWKNLTQVANLMPVPLITEEDADAELGVGEVCVTYIESRKAYMLYLIL